VVVATNNAGSSDAFPSAGNTLTIINAQDDGDSDGDGFPGGLELLFGANPFEATSVPTLTEQGTVLSPAVSVVNTLLPTGTPQEVLSPTVYNQTVCGHRHCFVRRNSHASPTSSVPANS
jgi:hypothetical protein